MLVTVFIHQSLVVDIRNGSTFHTNHINHSKLSNDGTDVNCAFMKLKLL